MHRLSKILICLICLAIIGYLIIASPYPSSWQDASLIQLLGIFLPLLVLFTILVDLFLNYLPRSFIIGLGLMVIVVLQALNVLSFWLIVEILAVSILTARLFPKLKLIYSIKIPKLRLSNKPNRNNLVRSHRSRKK